MTEQWDYTKAVDELIVPASKLLCWAETVRQAYYDLFSETHQRYVDDVLTGAHKLVDVIPTCRSLKSPLDQLHAFTHELSGPILRVRDSTTLVLLELEADKGTEHYRHIKRINSAAEYLYALTSDAVFTHHSHTERRNG